MTTELKLKWCSKYWDEIAVSSEHVYNVGYQVVLQARLGDVVVNRYGYTFSEAIDKVFDDTLELALTTGHYVD